MSRQNQNVGADEGKEKEAQNSSECPRYKSCTIPNGSTKQRSFHRGPYSDTTSKAWEKANKAKPTLIAIFILCLVLYCYIVVQSGMATLDRARKDPTGNLLPQNSDQSCIDLFKKNNCNVNRPIGEVCQRLLQCISPSSNITIPSVQAQLKNAFVNLQEFLENTLLLLGGMGTIGITHQVIKARNWMRKLPALLGGVIKQKGKIWNNADQIEEVREEVEEAD